MSDAYLEVISVRKADYNALVEVVRTVAALPFNPKIHELDRAVGAARVALAAVEAA